MKEKNESPFKKVHKTIQELIGEVNSKLKVNTWDGKPDWSVFVLLGTMVTS